MTTEPTCAAQVFEALKYNIEVDDDGTRRYYNSAGQLHRTDGPAVIWSDGTKYWYQNNHLHRTDGPAIEYANGAKMWFQNGVRHRTDGPAIERREGYVCYWYINGCAKTAEEFNECIASGDYSEP